MAALNANDFCMSRSGQFFFALPWKHRDTEKGEKLDLINVKAKPTDRVVKTYKNMLLGMPSAVLEASA